MEYLPEAAILSPVEVRARGFRLADAQAVIARKTGFAAWPDLARHVDCLRHMEGTWTFRSLEVDGQAIPSAMLANSLMLIDGDRFRLDSPEATYEGIFTIDLEPEPQRIDIDFIEGPEAGQRSEGPFQLDGDQFDFLPGFGGRGPSGTVRYRSRQRPCLGGAGAGRFPSSPGRGRWKAVSCGPRAG